MAHTVDTAAPDPDPDSPPDPGSSPIPSPSPSPRSQIQIQIQIQAPSLTRLAAGCAAAGPGARRTAGMPSGLL